MNAPVKTETQKAKAHSLSPGRHMTDGLIRISLAQFLVPITGFATSIFLSRRLGPENYGLFTLSALLISWIQFTITSMFSGTTLKFIAEAKDWRPVGIKILRLYLLISSLLMVLLWLLAAPIARLLDEEVMATHLRLIAIDIPLFVIAWVHMDILNGLGRYGILSIANASRWITRMLLIILFVELGFSVQGAILGLIGASVVELAITRYHVRPGLFARSTFQVSLLWGYSVPLFLSSVSLQIFSLDLFAFKMLGGTAAEAGVYGAAKNLVLMPLLVGGSISGLLLSTLTRVTGQGDVDSSRIIARNAMRGMIWLFPFATMTTGVATEVVGLIYGEKFLEAGPLVAILIFASVAQIVVLVTHAILTAGGKPRWTFILAGPMVPLAVAGYLQMIPRLGAIGTASVTTFVASFCAFLSIVAVYQMWKIYPPLATLVRSILICGLVYPLAGLWPMPGFLVLLKLPAIMLFIVLGLLLLGEFSIKEIVWARSLLPAFGTKQGL